MKHSTLKHIQGYPSYAVPTIQNEIDQMEKEGWELTNIAFATDYAIPNIILHFTKEVTSSTTKGDKE